MTMYSLGIPVYGSRGLGTLGGHLWRAFENTKGRPQAIVMSRVEFDEEG